MTSSKKGPIKLCSMLMMILEKNVSSSKSLMGSKLGVFDQEVEKPQVKNLLLQFLQLIRDKQLTTLFSNLDIVLWIQDFKKN